MKRSIYPITLARQPLSYSIRTTATAKFVSSLEYPVNPGVLGAIANDLNGVGGPSDYEFLQVATEEILNPMTKDFHTNPAQRIDYGPSPAEPLFHIWARLVDNAYIEVQHQLATVQPPMMPNDIPKLDLNLSVPDPTIQNYEHGDELDLGTDAVEQTPRGNVVPVEYELPTNTPNRWARFDKK